MPRGKQEGATHDPDWGPGRAIHEFEAHGIVDASEFMISLFSNLGCVDAADFAVPRSWMAPFALPPFCPAP